MHSDVPTKRMFVRPLQFASLMSEHDACSWNSRIVEQKKSPWPAVTTLLWILVVERESAQRGICQAQRRVREAEVQAHWAVRAALGETAGEVFRARTVAAHVARAIVAHRDATSEPTDVDLELWGTLDKAWDELDEEWGIEPPVRREVRPRRSGSAR